MAKGNTEAAAGCIVLTLYFGFWLAVFGAVAYVAYHFISKVW